VIEADERCESCKVGYHAPFERFEKVAVVKDGPALLQRCSVCGTYWLETLHDARQMGWDEAFRRFPEMVPVVAR
jgi:uncharacterized Zn finger protein